MLEVIIDVEDRELTTNLIIEALQNSPIIKSKKLQSITINANSVRVKVELEQ